MVNDDEAVASRALHARLLLGDVLAKEDACHRYLEPLARWLGYRYRTTDAEVVHDAVVQTLLDYVDQPERFDPRLRSLVGYLRMSAERDLQNLRVRHARRQERESGGDPVELETSGGNVEVGRDHDVGDEVAAEDAAERLRAAAMALTEDDEERAVLRLVLDGVRATEEYARELGWTTLPESEQRDRVNRIKERVLKRLRRRLPRTNDG